MFNKIYEKGKEDSAHELYECPWCGTVGAVRKEIAHASQKDGVM